MPKKHTSRHIGLIFSFSLTSFLLDALGLHNAIYGLFIGIVNLRYQDHPYRHARVDRG